MWHTDLLLAFLCSHAISPTIAWCKKSGTWDCIKSSYHLGAFYAGLAEPNGNALSEPSLLTHTLALFTIPQVSSYWSRTGCRCSQAGSSTMTSPHKVKKGGFEFLKGRGRWRVCAFVCLWGALRVTEDSFAVCQHSSESIWAHRDPSLKPDHPAALCFKRSTMTNLYLLSFHGVEELSYLPVTGGLTKSGGSTRLIFQLPLYVQQAVRAWECSLSCICISSWHQAQHFTPSFSSTCLLMDSTAIFMER